MTQPTYIHLISERVRFTVKLTDKKNPTTNPRQYWKMGQGNEKRREFLCQETVIQFASCSNQEKN